MHQHTQRIVKFYCIAFFPNDIKRKHKQYTHILQHPHSKTIILTFKNMDLLHFFFVILHYLHSQTHTHIHTRNTNTLFVKQLSHKEKTSLSKK